jgi:putative ABC transport system ATP-binding protein
MATSMIIVQVQKLTKVYSEIETPVVALDDVSLEIKQGEFVAIVGPSGSGKSTLLHLIGALDTPTNGTYLLRGNNVASMSDDALSKIRRSEIGFVFQVFNLIGQMNVLDNVALPLRYAGMGDEEAEARAEVCLSRVGLLHRKSHLPSQLSGGEKQRAAIARALAIEPAVLLADEPTGNLDSSSGETILTLFDELHAEGHTIIVVTHDKQVAARSDRVITICDGKIVEPMGNEHE